MPCKKDCQCPECGFTRSGVKSCGCKGHEDKCLHCWSWEEIEHETTIDGMMVVTTFKCLTCGELFERESQRDPYEIQEDRLDRLEQRAEEARDRERGL